MVATPTNWSLSDEPWQVLRDLLKFEPLSWSYAPFHQGAANAVPEAPGIYLVCARPVASLSTSTPHLLNVLYVGQASSSIRERFNYHLSANAKTKMKKARKVFSGNLSFYWTETSRFREIEMLIYDAFGPPINDTSPPRITGFLGEARPVRLPARVTISTRRKP